MITEISRRLTGQYIYSNNSIIFDSAPYLLANNEITMYFDSNDNRINTTILSIANNAAVVNFSSAQYANNRVSVRTPCYSTGITGVQEVFTLYNSTIPSTLLQASKIGSGAVVLSVEASADNIGWANVGSIDLSTAVTGSILITSPWPKARINVASVGANTTLLVTKAN